MKLNNMKRKIELTPKELERKAMLKVINQIHKLKSKLADMSNEYVKKYCPFKEGDEFKFEHNDEFTYRVGHYIVSDKMNIFYNATWDKFEFMGHNPKDPYNIEYTMNFLEDEVTFL